MMLAAACVLVFVAVCAGPDTLGVLFALAMVAATVFLVGVLLGAVGYLLLA